MIDIVYRNKECEKMCEDTEYAVRKIGNKPARELAKLMNALFSSNSLLDITAMPRYRLHQLKGDKKDIYSFSIDQKYRMEFYPLDENKNRLKSGIDEKDMFKNTRYIQIERITNHYE